MTMSKEAEEFQGKIVNAILQTDWTKIEKFAKKMRRRKYISQGTQ